jgi:hypothetical protein
MTRHTEQVGLVEVSSDGKTVWVNGAGGWSIGRVSMTGVDYGGSSRLKAKAGPLTKNDWVCFQFDMLDIHGVRVSDKHMPEFLRVSA